jgi:membrane protein DedA with SNARE-associated domain
MGHDRHLPAVTGTLSGEMETSDRRFATRAARWLPAIPVVILLIVVAIYVTAEGNLTEGFLDLRDWFRWIVRSYGAAGSLGLLYIEESGVPLPVPGDVYVIYLGHQAHGVTSLLLAAWLSIIAVVLAGSTNLYFISRRWGPRLIEHPLARVFHLEPERLEKAKEWFDRWGVLAVIFGRHIPGFRVPITVLAGTLGFPYRFFVPSVAVSTAIWAGVFILVGDKLGGAIARFTSANAWVYAVGTILLLGAIGLIAFRASRAMSAKPKPSA